MRQIIVCLGLLVFVYPSVADSVDHRVTVIGTGYVGLVSGVVFADLGYEITCLDIDPVKIKQLQEGKMPILEKGVDTLLKKHVASEKLRFTTDAALAIKGADIIFVTVGTPMQKDGTADLRAFISVFKDIVQYVQDDAIVCIKSTVPIGTATAVCKQFSDCFLNPERTVSLVSNPEFLREGSALDDFLTRNPIIVGTSTELAHKRMRRFYEPLVARGSAYVPTNNVVAETIKYAWNAFSATRITYINQLAQLCNAVGADVYEVIAGMAFSDALCPTNELCPGPGYGGSCFPKDTRALVALAAAAGVDLSLVREVVAANETHKEYVLSQLYGLLNGTVAGKKIALLGLTFKENTDDIRESPAIIMIEALLKRNAQIYAYDPAGKDNMQSLFPYVTYTRDMYEAVSDADAVLVLTPWEEFKTASLEQIARSMHTPIIVDTRNVWAPDELRRHGFVFANMGRKT